MSRVRRLSRAVTLIALLLLYIAPSSAAAAPATYFGSGTADLTVINTTLGGSALDQPTPVNIALGGSTVTVDLALGAHGTLLALKLMPQSSFTLDLDETQVALDVIEITNSMLTEALGATAALTSSGSFSLDTEMTGIVTGVTIPFGPAPFADNTSGATGFLGVNGNQVTLGLVGVNVATFDSMGMPPGTGDIEVKADFTFVGVIPEPGTALLLGLGLAGLAGHQRRSR